MDCVFCLSEIFHLREKELKKQSQQGQGSAGARVSRAGVSWGRGQQGQGSAEAGRGKQGQIQQGQREGKTGVSRNKL